MSWNESGRPSRRAEGYRQYEGQGYSGGDSLGAAIFLGIVGIAWGIGELFEAIGGR